MTAQISETLIYEDQKLSMCSQPLDYWLCTAGKDIDFQSTSTACWRGYTGTWKVINDRLYLASLNGTGRDGSKLRMKDLFPDHSKGVFAHWFSGEVRCPFGKMLDYVHMGYGSTFEKDLYLTFKKGMLVAKRVITNGVGKEGDPEGYGVAAFTTFPVDKSGSQ
jgi:hypothetical protein